MTRSIATLLILSSLLSGCAGFLSATREEPIREDPGSRTLGQYVEDEAIETKVLVNISKGSPALAHSNINVTSYNGQVLLTGQVGTQDAKQEAERITQLTREVRKIHNELEISGPTSAIVRTNDAYLTSRVKLALVADTQLQAGRIKVVTENGTVFLMGLVRRKEADIAVTITRSISGVRRIVKVFEYID